MPPALTLAAAGRREDAVSAEEGGTDDIPRFRTRSFFNLFFSSAVSQQIQS